MKSSTLTMGLPHDNHEKGTNIPSVAYSFEPIATKWRPQARIIETGTGTLVFKSKASCYKSENFQTSNSAGRTLVPSLACLWLDR